MELAHRPSSELTLQFRIDVQGGELQLLHVKEGAGPDTNGPSSTPTATSGTSRARTKDDGMARVEENQVSKKGTDKDRTERHGPERPANVSMEGGIHGGISRADRPRWG